MRIDIDTWEEIIVTITRNKTRSFLTAFGVFWGIFMLVALLGGGNGMKNMMYSNFEGFASNSCFVWPQRTGEAYKGFSKGRWWRLENDDVTRLKMGVPGIDVITPTINRWGALAVFDDKKSSCITKGLYPNYNEIEWQSMLYGRFINDVDIIEGRKVCVIGKRVYTDLFHSGTNPLGQHIRVDGIYYQIVGVCISSGGMEINGRADESVVLPFTTMQRTYNYGNSFDLLCMTAKPGIKISELQPKIEEIIKRGHYIHPDDKQAVMLLNAEAMFQLVDNLFLGINVLILMVGLGTLLAGAIGVSNIMMVTVKERTTELGIRRAIGARPRDILQQILSESMVLTTIAGMAGISLAVLVLQGLEIVVNANPDFVNYINFQVGFWLAIGTGALLIALGMLAGLAPAYRAMSIKPIDAIRDE